MEHNPTPDAQGEWHWKSASRNDALVSRQEAEARLRKVTAERDENGRIAHQQTVLVKAQQAKLKAQEQELERLRDALAAYADAHAYVQGLAWE